MPVALRTRLDTAPTLVPLAGFTARREDDAAVIAALQQKPVEVMQARMNAGHRPYIAYVDGNAAAWGWVATRSADVGELSFSFTLPEGERYLWNFVTLPQYRGRGIYPRLVDAIVRAEESEAEAFWIACAPENRASFTGILKAGFTPVADLSFDAEGRAALQRGDRGGDPRIFGLPIVTEDLAPCWRCVRAGRPPMSCAPGTCRCDYQEPKSGCAA